ncbi:MAG: ABC transporter permease [Elusimicrobia bacterium]|nr:ABC transporter permease [Elusimicrobiota bacterium]
MAVIKAFGDTIGSFGRAVIFLGEIAGCILRGKIRWRLVAEQVFEQGVQSLLIVLLAAFASGAVLAMQGQVMMERFGAKEFIAQLVALSLVRELGPIFTALVFSGKSGAGMAAELGTMSVNNQIAATRTMGVDPVEFLVVPRVVACLIALPVLVVLAEIVGILGGYVIGVYEAGVPSAYYWTQTINSIGFVDFFSGFIKVFFFAGLIGWVCAFQGFFTGGGSLGVGRHTTIAVAFCYVGVIVSNTVLTKMILMFWGY